MNLPPNFWLLGREEYVTRCGDFCARLQTALVSRYDNKYANINPKTGEPYKEPELFSMDLDEEYWEEFVDQIGYREVMGKAKSDRFAALSGDVVQGGD